MRELRETQFTYPIRRRLSGRPAPFHPLGTPEASLSILLQKAVCHEAYHAGQLGVGRRLVGKSGAIA